MNFELPGPVQSVTAIAGNANPFLCMLMMGLMLELHLDRKEAFLVRKILVWRYVLTIVFATAMFVVLPLEVDIKKIILIMLSAPVAQMAPIFSMRIDPDSNVPAAVMSVSILISVILMTVLVTMFA